MKATLRSSAIHCDKCAQRVRETFDGHPGVQSVDVHPQTRLVTVDFDPAATNLSALSEKLGRAGYPVEESAQQTE